MKTAELTGARLDQAVAKACGYKYDLNISEDFIVTSLDPYVPSRPPEIVHVEMCRAVIDGQLRTFSPSTNWAHGGPIIERERIELGTSTADSDWYARPKGFERSHVYYGPTPLIAAMRAFVASKLGDEVDV